MLWEINFVVGSICVYIEQYKFTFQLKCVYYLRLYDLDPVTLILKLLQRYYEDVRAYTKSEFCRSMRSEVRARTDGPIRTDKCIRQNCCAPFVNLRNLQNALHNFEIAHVLFVNFRRKPDPEPNLNRNPTLELGYWTESKSILFDSFL